jgi:hypothetical protein
MTFHGYPAYWYQMLTLRGLHISTIRSRKAVLLATLTTKLICAPGTDMFLEMRYHNKLYLHKISAAKYKLLSRGKLRRQSLVHTELLDRKAHHQRAPRNRRHHDENVMEALHVRF